MEPILTISDLARASGVAASAVRFYEKHGLVTSQRTAGNQRRCSEVDACLIKIIRVAQRVGLSVAEIRQRIQALTEVLDDLTSDQKLCQLPPVTRATSSVTL